jgi:N-acetylglucosamine PTS system EIICBA or EIICB component
MVRPAPQALQVVIGTVADQLAGEIRAALHSAPPRAAAVVHAAAPAPTVPAAAAPAVVGETPSWNARAAALLSALGGRANVRTVEVAASSRLRVSVAEAALLDQRAIRELGLRGVATPAAGSVHLIVGPGAAEAAAALRQLLA